MSPPLARSGHKDLQDLRKLSRVPALSYLRKQAQPPAPRHKLLKAAPAPSAFHQKVAAFSPARLWQWICGYLSHRIGRRHAFQTYRAGDGDNGVYPLESEAGAIRVALAADWGSGTDEAASIGDHIAAFDPHYSIHLGDVYYVGDLAEVKENFLGIRNPESGYEPVAWPKGSRGSFALNANHEMYALGHAYFDAILPALGLMRDGRPQGQRASFFCLENEHWRVIALDTGYNSIGWPIIEYFFACDSALPAPIIDWLRDVVRPRPDDPRGIVILSHHPCFSRFDSFSPTPARQLSAVFQGPVLWFWGHEHRLAIYQEAAGAGGIRTLGRCIGHGGMPIELPSKTRYPEYQLEFLDDRPYPNDEQLEIGFNGFARLTFDGPLLAVDYVDVHGAVVFSESWTAGEGTLRRVSTPAKAAPAA